MRTDQRIISGILVPALLLMLMNGEAPEKPRIQDKTATLSPAIQLQHLEFSKGVQAATSAQKIKDTPNLLPSDAYMDRVSVIRRNFLKFAVSLMAVAMIPTPWGYFWHFIGKNLGGYRASRNRNIQMAKNVVHLLESIEDHKWLPRYIEATHEKSTILFLTQCVTRGISAKNTFVTIAAIEGLMLHPSPEVTVLGLFKNAFEAFPKDTEFQKTLIQRIALYYTVAPHDKLQDLIQFLYEVARIDGKSPLAVKQQALAGLMFIGNAALRHLKKLLREARQANDVGMRLKFALWIQNLIHQIDPSFPVDNELIKDTAESRREFLRRFRKGEPFAEKEAAKKYAVTPDKIREWGKNLHSRDEEKKIEALRNLDEVSPDTIDRNQLIALLENASAPMKKVILSILGSDTRLAVETQKLLLTYLEEPDTNLALAAANALRWRKGLPAERILARLNRGKNPQRRQQLEYILLASLDSEDAGKALIRSIIMTDPKNNASKKNLIDALRVWYMGQGLSLTQPFSPDPLAPRDERVFKALGFLPPYRVNSPPRDIQEMVQTFLRRIAAISIQTGMPFDIPFEALPESDEMTALERIIIEISKRGLRFFSVSPTTETEGAFLPVPVITAISTSFSVTTGFEQAI